MVRHDVVLVTSLLAGREQYDCLPPQATDRTDWTAFIFGCIAGAAPWVAIAIYLAGAGSGQGDVPTFVYWLFGTIFVVFNIFAVNMFLQYRRLGPWKGGCVSSQGGPVSWAEQTQEPLMACPDCKATETTRRFGATSLGYARFVCHACGPRRYVEAVARAALRVITATPNTRRTNRTPSASELRPGLLRPCISAL